MKTIFQTTDIGEMTVIKSILDAAGIKCMLLDEYYSHIVQPALIYTGGGRLAVADEQEAEARALIEDFIKTVKPELSLTETGLAHTPKCPACGSTEFAPAFWSVFFGGDKYKCKNCGTKFELDEKKTDA